MFVLHFRSYPDIYGSVKRVVLEERRYRQEDIVRTVIGKSWYTEPGKIIKNAVMTNLGSCIGEGDGPYTLAEYSVHEAQEFKTIHYEFEREDHFNRKSGRYLYSRTKYTYNDKKAERDFEHLDSVKDLSGSELLEEQR